MNTSTHLQAHFIFCQPQAKQKNKKSLQANASPSAVVTWTGTALNVNRFNEHFGKLESASLRGKIRAAHNIRLKEILKRRALFGNQTVVLLTNSCGNTNSGASNPFFLKLL